MLCLPPWSYLCTTSKHAGCTHLRCLQPDSAGAAPEACRPTPPASAPFFGSQAPTCATFYLFSWRAESEGLSAALGRLRHTARPERPSLPLY